MRNRSKPKFVTLRAYPAVGVFRVRILEDQRTRLRVLDIREALPDPGKFSRYGVRIANRWDLELLSSVLLSVLRDPIF
jgi:hypothetical protein